MKRHFTPQDQDRFAALSGDFNPLHLDAMAARRTFLGRPVVHGIHLLLGSLQTYVDTPRRLTALTARFLAPLGVGEEGASHVVKTDAGSMDIILESHGAKIASFKITFVDGVAPNNVIPDALPERLPCRERAAAAMAQACGSLPLTLSSEKTEELFPGLLGKLPADQIALLLATTRLVGMECPGLDSLYKSLSLRFDPALPARDALNWKADSFDARFQLASLALESSGTRGTIEALLRPRPQKQPSVEALRDRVLPEMFSGRKALVIGGSRGIGEVCAKLLALGGAEVRLTYHRGAADAQKIVEDLSVSGHSAVAFSYDALAPTTDLKEKMGQGWFPTHVYYFPTPPIFTASKGRYAEDLFQSFYAYYVRGFLALYEGLRAMAPDALTMLYPSSIAVEDPPSNMGEYAAAKAAGEALSRFLMTNDRHLHIDIIRLPRLPTDQTANVLNISSADMVETTVALLK